MAVTSLIEALGYLQSGKFVSPASAEKIPASEVSFAVRHIAQTCERLDDRTPHCTFNGTYVLQEKTGAPPIPVVYVFETSSDVTARQIHRIVWNQNLVPFIIITSPSSVRLYPGFSYDAERDKPLVVAVGQIADVLRELSDFEADSINTGRIWQRWGHAADPTQRVDEKLLNDLKSLDTLLQAQEVTREASHGIIGNFVYLYYLRHRNILSNRKLEKWGVNPETIFTRNATLKAFRQLNNELQHWLNGAVFQLGQDALLNLTEDQLRLAAGVFCGDSPNGQFSLFEAYDFSHIPIETLSCVYEQFLHDDLNPDGRSRGKQLGAYYTPIPLADYVISEMERKRPLIEGMRVLDPACGSGTFLVECYRRLVEKKIRLEQRELKTTELRELLTKHIFGIDRDDDACRIAELSLILTLLDYVEPPDLENTNFKLPKLREHNIFKDDFFRESSNWATRFDNETFDWIVGNPPWAEIKGTPGIEHEHYNAWHWMTVNRPTNPVGGNQIAEAFLWKAGSHVKPTSAIGLLVPAMTWFKKESKLFRQQFFSVWKIWCLANFANFMETLFAGRARSPASAVFYQAIPPDDDDTILTFAPFVAEQIANRPQEIKSRINIWNIVVNGAEVHEVENSCAKQGAGLTWKLAMWGTNRDRKLLERIGHRYSTFEDFCSKYQLKAHEGFQLRVWSANAAKDLEARQELIGKKKADFNKLRLIGPIFSFPDWALGTISEEEAYLRKRGGGAGLVVSQPPHILVDAARRFAVFSNEFIAVPPRQVGIRGPRGSEPLLKSLGLFLSSEFFAYHQFLASPKWGIDQNLADLDTLKKLPVPLNELTDRDIAEWSAIYDELALLTDKSFDESGLNDSQIVRRKNLLDDLNARVFSLLGLRSTERFLVEDFVRFNMNLRQGAVPPDSINAPTVDHIRVYVNTLRDCLDDFLSANRRLRHKIEVVTNEEAGFLSISVQRASKPLLPLISTNREDTSKEMLSIRDALRKEHSQWIYFDRKLKVYYGDVLYQFKPMQRLHWTRRQAVLDSDDIISDTISQGKT
jgi:restriction-modification enzyme MmeI-like protein